MKTPRYTDLYRYPRPYRHAKDTNIAETIAAEIARLKEQKPSNVRDLSDVFKNPRHGK